MTIAAGIDVGTSAIKTAIFGVETFRGAHPEIPWRAMTDVRNILIHAYDRVASEILAGIVRRDIPPLLASVKRILGED